MFKRTRSLSNAVYFKHDNNVCARHLITVKTAVVWTTASYLSKRNTLVPGKVHVFLLADFSVYLYRILSFTLGLT